LKRFGTVSIIGVGLIGGSIGMVLRGRRLAEEVVGVGRDPHSLDEAVRKGAIDRGTTDLARGVADADIVVVCTPVSCVAADACRAAESAPSHVLITDAGSSKRMIVEAVERHPRAAGVFVGAHPLAGSEQRGPAHARGDLFDGRVCVLTPTLRTRLDRIHRALGFWTALGCRVLEMTPSEHDEILAYTSHLPHALAAALAASVPVQWLPLTAGAYRDGTRVAAADSGLWTAIFRDNRGPLLKALGTLQECLDVLKYALMNDDDAAIRAWWDQGKKSRHLLDAELEPAEPVSHHGMSSS
jgi:prephenate dehydrogenase